MASVSKISFNADSTNLLSKPLISSANTTVQQDFNNKNSKKSLNSAEKLAIVSSAVAIASLGISTAFAVKNGKITKKYSSAIDNITKNIHEEFTNAAQNTREDILKISKDLKTWVSRTKNRNRTLEKKIDNMGEWFNNWVKDVQKTAREAAEKPTLVKVEKLNTSSERNLANIDNLQLLQNLTNENKRKPLPPAVTEKLQKAADKYIHGKTEPIAKLDKNSTIWSVTAESIPEKEGGLGEVPVQIAKNLTHELGIDNFIVRPINEIKGLSKIISQDGKYSYQYAGTTMPVDKVMDFKVPVFRNGRYYDENVEVFFGIDPKFKYKRLMFKNDTYFSAKSLYENSQSVSEPERYTFFPKVVYEFLKIKADPNAMTSYNITNKALFDSIKTPDAFLANDWHAAAIPALTKLLAPVEAAMGDLNKKAAEKIEKMNVVELVHNLDYQGESWEHASEMLNTLFGKYALDIYENANSGFLENGIQKVLTVEGGVNLANLSAMLANKVKPVSPTYATELAHQFVRSRSLQHVFDVRLANGTIKGHSNGWDRSVNELSIANLNDFNANLNKDKCLIFQSVIENLKDVSESQAKTISDVFQNIDKDGIVKYNNFSMALDTLKKLKIPALNKALEQLDEDSIIYLRSFKPVQLADGMETVMQNRLHNKEMLLGYLKRMVDYNHKTGTEFFNIKESGLTDLSEIDWNNLDEIPVIDMGVRFCEQKGVDIACGTIESLLADWGKLFPGKPKPVFVIGGADNTGGTYRNMALAMKQRLGQNGKQVIYMDGFTPNNILQAGSDFTWFPSHFEPDGSKWESLYKGTPVIATRVGGHVDSIQDGINGFLTKRTVPEIKSSGYEYLSTMIYDFKEANIRALNTFFDKPKYRQMVENDLKGNASWLIKNDEGKITGGALLEHLQDLGFDLKDFPQIAENAVI